MFFKRSKNTSVYTARKARQEMCVRMLEYMDNTEVYKMSEVVDIMLLVNKEMTSEELKNA